MIYARQSTAIIVTVGPTLDADGVAVTGGVVGDYKISKNGGAPAALNASATYTHRHTGYGSLSLTASDVDTVGTVEITMDDTVNACPMKELQVVEPAVYDALFADAATGYQVPIWAAAGSTVNLSATTVNLVNTLTTYTGNTPQTGDSFARIGAPTGASIAADLAGVQSDTNDIQTRIPAALTNRGNMLTDEVLVNTTIATLASQTSFTLTAGSTDNDAYKGCVVVIEDASTAAQKAVGVVSAYTGATKTITLVTDPAVFTMATTDKVTILADRSLKPTVDNSLLTVTVGGVKIQPTNTIGDTVLTSAVSSWTVNLTGNLSGSVGSVTGAVGSVTGAVGSVTGDVGGNVTGTIGGFTAAAKADIESEVNDALVAQRLDELLNADSDIDGAAPPTVGSVFHELMSKTAGSFTFDQTTDSNEALRDRGDAAWITATSVTVSDKTGFSLSATGLDLVTAWTTNIIGNITGNLSGSVGSVTGAVGSVTGAVGSVTGNVGGNVVGSVASVTGAVGSVTGNVTGSVGSLATQAKADVNAEVLDVLSVDAFAELAADPGASPTIVKAIMLLYMALRNKIDITATAKEIHNNAGTLLLTKTLSDDGTTYSETKVA